MRRRADVVGRAVLPVPRARGPRWWRRLLRRIARRTDATEDVRTGGAADARRTRPNDSPTRATVPQYPAPAGACVAVIDATVLDRG